MNSLLPLSFLCALALVISLHFRAASASTAAYPTIPRTDSVDCSIAGGDPDAEKSTIMVEYLISLTNTSPTCLSGTLRMALVDTLWLEKSMKNGSRANNSAFKLGVHTGTHVDTLDLEVLNGYTLLVDVPRDTNITGVDYLSAAAYDHSVLSNLVFLEGRVGWFRGITNTMRSDQIIRPCEFEVAKPGDGEIVA